MTTYTKLLGLLREMGSAGMSPAGFGLFFPGYDRDEAAKG